MATKCSTITGTTYFEERKKKETVEGGNAEKRIEGKKKTMEYTDMVNRLRR